jgi:hypothetical protein
MYVPLAGLMSGCQIVAGIQDITLTPAENDGSSAISGDSSGVVISPDGASDAGLPQDTWLPGEGDDGSSSVDLSVPDASNEDIQQLVVAEAAVPPESGVRDADAAGGIDPDARSGSGFCASQVPQPSFCDDFDEHPLPGAWGTFDQVGGSLVLDKAAFVSPPHSLLAQDSPLQPNQALDNALRSRFTLPMPPSKIVLQFEVQPVAADTSSGAATVVAALDFVDVSNNRYSAQFALVQQGGVLRLRLEEQSGFVDGGNAYVAHQLPDSLSAGMWTNVRLVITRTAATTASAHVSFGSVSEIDTALAMTVNGTTLQLAIGSSFETEPSQGWKIRYDDIKLDY